MTYVIFALALVLVAIVVLSILTYVYVQKNEDLKALLNGEIAAWDYREKDDVELVDADVTLVVVAEDPK
jgi:acyl-CoA synthetase (AMP-forming)/AMP-acid ligase II